MKKNRFYLFQNAAGKKTDNVKELSCKSAFSVFTRLASKCLSGCRGALTSPVLYDRGIGIGADTCCALETVWKSRSKKTGLWALQHVLSHFGFPGNDIADQRVKQGSESSQPEVHLSIKRASTLYPHTMTNVPPRPGEENLG
ncbi:hypothetical protein TNCV_1071851 [Trichonephila clavipes]|nr:hypothetical protein TNCV_1071851 [Trichonephila clavipes]